jgi:hypothetical protein
MWVRGVWLTNLCLEEIYTHIYEEEMGLDPALKALFALSVLLAQSGGIWIEQGSGGPQWLPTPRLYVTVILSSIGRRLSSSQLYYGCT